ncbi:MAG: glycosyltransferase family 10 domain-containing protein [Desulfuromonadales bacterium]
MLTFQEEQALPHVNATRTQTGNIWFYEKSFDELSRQHNIPKKKIISTVCSSKRQVHTMHGLRYDFTQKLKAEVPDLEIFGHGVRYVKKKSEALDPFKFHLVVENHIALHQWTEKLADAFLAYTVPIYCGCPNVFDYFPEDSVILIDINDFEGSLQTVLRVLTTEGEYERRLSAVKEARRLVMYEYNLPAMLNRIISEAEPAESVEAGTIYCRQAMRVKHPADLIRFASWRIGNFLKTLASYLKRWP